jgi:hypothetical protein
MVDFLVGKSTDILNMVDVTGRNALHYTLQFADEFYREEIYKILTDHNITNHVDNDGFDVIHFAAWRGIVRQLLKTRSTLLHSRTNGLSFHYIILC